MSERNAEIVIGLQRERMERAEARILVLTQALEAVRKVRPSNWDDDEDPEQAEAWAVVDAALLDDDGCLAGCPLETSADSCLAVECPHRKPVPKCVNHPDRPSRTNLDGDELCQQCADDWVKAEGQHAAWLEAEEGKAP